MSKKITVKVDSETPIRWANTAHEMFKQGMLTMEEFEGCLDFVRRCLPVIFVRKVSEQ